MFKSFMAEALKQAKQAQKSGEVPIGAVVIDQHGDIIAQDHNRVIALNDPTAHAEILVIRKACQLVRCERLINCSLYVTIEPCPMCASAISQARIAKLYFGADDKKSGGVENGPLIFNQSSCHWKPEVYGGIMETEAKHLMKSFFAGKRSS